MITYFHSILIITVGCQLVLMIANEITGEHSQKLLRFLSGCVVLLSLFAPLKYCITHLSSAMDTLFFTEDSIEDTQPSQTTVIYDSTYYYIAQNWIQYIAETYNIENADIKVVMLTDEKDILTEAQVYLANCPYTLRRRIEQDLLKKMKSAQQETEVLITVYGE